MKILNQRCPKILDWPSNSPDLNPIENLWGILKRHVEKQVNKLVIKKKSVTIDCFFNIIKEEWEGIEISTHLNLVRSMSERLEEVIRDNRNKISY